MKHTESIISQYGDSFTMDNGSVKIKITNTDGSRNECFSTYDFGSFDPVGNVVTYTTDKATHLLYLSDEQIKLYIDMEMWEKAQ